MAKMRLKGKVIKNKMDKTVTVEVLRRRPDPIYKKYETRKKKYQAHSEKEIEVGMTVVIEESKPISKTKRWRVVEVIDDLKNKGK